MAAVEERSSRGRWERRRWMAKEAADRGWSRGGSSKRGRRLWKVRVEVPKPVLGSISS